MIFVQSQKNFKEDNFFVPVAKNQNFSPEHEIAKTKDFEKISNFIKPGNFDTKLLDEEDTLARKILKLSQLNLKLKKEILKKTWKPNLEISNLECLAENLVQRCPVKTKKPTICVGVKTNPTQRVSLPIMLSSLAAAWKKVEEKLNSSIKNLNNF